MREIVLKNVPIVGDYYDEDTGYSDYNGSYDTDYDYDDYGSDIVVNSYGNYERFDDISLYDYNDDLRSETDKSEVCSEEIEAFLNDITEDERSHIIDVMCRDLELEVQKNEKIK